MRHAPPFQVFFPIHETRPLILGLVLKKLQKRSAKIQTYRLRKSNLC